MITKLTTKTKDLIRMFVSVQRNIFPPSIKVYKKPTRFSQIPYQEQYEDRDFTIKTKPK